MKSENRIFKISFSDIINSLEKIALSDKTLSSEEKNLIEGIIADFDRIQDGFNSLVNTISSEKFIQLFHTAKSEVVKNAFSLANQDNFISEDEQSIINQLIQELENYHIDTRLLIDQNDNWFVFKTVVQMEDQKDYINLLSLLDFAYCNRLQIPQSGICVGTKHFQLYNEKSGTGNHVTLLIFTIDDRLPKTRLDWIMKGSFASLDFDIDVDVFEDLLNKTAQNLLDQYFNNKLSFILPS